MIYCQLADRVRITTGETLRLTQVAKLLGTDDAELTVRCPDQVGVWKLHALDVARLLRRAFPGEEVTMLGADVCYIHRLPARHADPGRPLRTIAAFSVLFIGSALGLAWFHSDVDMPRAMQLVYALFVGQEVADVRLITWPYIVGVALGVAIFYDLAPRRSSVTPLEVKMSEYQGEMEQAEGKDIPDA